MATVGAEMYLGRPIWLCPFCERWHAYVPLRDGSGRLFCTVMSVPVDPPIQPPPVEER
jgi:hypothetical protein